MLDIGTPLRACDMVENFYKIISAIFLILETLDISTSPNLKSYFIFSLLLNFPLLLKLF